MRWIILVLLMALCILTVICYALCVMAHEADERAEKMYRKWKEQLEYDMQNNGEPIDSDYNIGIDHAVCVLGVMKGADDEYERAVEQMEYDMLYEPTYNPEDGSM